MAKKKGQAAKTFPKIGQEWKDSSGKIPHYLLIVSTAQDTDNKQTWECEDESEDEEGQKKLTARTLHLADFQESFMQIEHDPESEEKSPPPEPEITIEMMKPGFAFVCPSPNCGDKHVMENTTTWSEVVAARERFHARHVSHLTEGTLFSATKR